MLGEEPKNFCGRKFPWITVVYGWLLAAHMYMYIYVHCISRLDNGSFILCFQPVRFPSDVIFLVASRTSLFPVAETDFLSRSFYAARTGRTRTHVHLHLSWSTLSHLYVYMLKVQCRCYCLKDYEPWKHAGSTPVHVNTLCVARDIHDQLPIIFPFTPNHFGYAVITFSGIQEQNILYTLITTCKNHNKKSLLWPLQHGGRYIWE